MTPTIAPTTVPTQVPTAAPTVAPTKKPVKASVSKKLIQPVKASENANQLFWNPVKNADGYFIYASACNENGKERKVKKIADIKNRTTTSYTHKNCEKDTWYKYRITAYRIIGKKKTAISKSLELHSLTKGSKTYENPSRVKIRYLVSDSSVLTVSKKGKIRAKKAGHATIYAVAQNGVTAKIKVSVIAAK
ncbi:MAG: Ig-like domain-containing protein [Clostridium sp.]